MNKHNALLAALDKVYGHNGNNTSTFKPINRYFNQETGEMITTIIYRTKKQGEVIVSQKQNISNNNQGLLQAILKSQKNKSE